MVRGERSKRVLVTGGAGFLGQHILKKLVDEGCTVVAIVRRSSNLDSLRGMSVDLVFGDLRDDEVIEEAMDGVDVVIHAAATMAGSWEDFEAINVHGTRRLLEAARVHRVSRFIHISSVSVYDHTSAKPGHTFTEDMEYESQQFTFYSQSKIEAEKVVWKYVNEHNLPCVILRPGALYGIGGPIYPAQLGLPLGGKRFGLIGDGRSSLPLCHVQSVVDAIWMSMVDAAAVGSCYNLVEDDSIRRLDYVRKVREIANPELSIVRIPYWIARSMSYFFGIVFGFLGRKAPLRPLYLKTASSEFYYSNQRIKAELGWKPGVDLEPSINALLEWHRARRTPRRRLPIVRGRVEIPSTEKVSVAVVGCGAISDVHLSILKGIENAQVVSLCDPSPEARSGVSKKYGIGRTYATLTEALEGQHVDVVHILTPAQSHADLAVEAMRKGSHVLVEKPMALNAEEAQEMARVAEEENVKLCVGHNHLFDGVMLRARELLAAGAVGQITYVESWYGVGLSSDGGNRVLSYASRDSWAYRLPGALYQDYIAHPISVLLDVMHEASHPRVAAKYSRIVPYMQSDELRVLVENNEAMGLVAVSLASSPRYQFMKIYGTAGTLNVDLVNKYVFVDKPMGPVPKTIARNLSNLKQGAGLLKTGVRNLLHFATGRLSLFEGTERLIRLYYRSILLDEPVPVSSQEGVESMQLMDEIWAQLHHTNGHATRVETRDALRAKTA